MEISLGLWAAFAAMLCWGFGDFFIQRTTRRIGSVESLFFIGLFGSIVLFPFVAPDLPAILNWNDLLLLGFLGVMTFIVAIFNFEGLRLGKLSIIDVLLEIELPITVILGLVVLGESVSFVQLALMGLILGGCILIALESLPPPTASAIRHPQKEHPLWKDSDALFHVGHWSVTLEKGVAFGLLAAFGMGILNFTTGIASKGISPLMAIWAPWIIFTVISFIVIVQRKGLGLLLENAVRYPKLIIAESVLDTAAWVFFAIALFGNPISITTAITESYPAIALLLGFWINQEQIALHQWAGIALAIFSSVTLVFLV